MGFSVGNFLGGMLSVMIGGVVLGACLTIFAGITVPEGMANGSAIEALIALLPILVVIGLVISAVYIFVVRK